MSNIDLDHLFGFFNMAAYGWELTADEVKEILPADLYRDEILIQLYTSEFEEAINPVYVAFGETAEVGKGLCLGNQGHTVRIKAPKSFLAVSAICVSNAVGGIETYTNLEYRHVLNWPPWNTDPMYPRWPSWPKN